MNTAGLSLSDAPPFERIYPFFISSALFGALSGVTFLFANSIDRYDPYILSSIHLFTIGFLLNAAFGALSQMLPVVGGVKIESPKIIRLAQVGISLGAVLFFCGFVFYRPLLWIAVVVLAISLLFGFGMLLIKIYLSKGSVSNTAKGIRLAIIVSLIAFLIGIHLLFSHILVDFGESHAKLTSVHIALALFGFFSTLVIAVAHQVLPMFYVSSEFPKFCRVWPAVIFVSSLLILIPNEPIELAAKITIWIALAAFATVALKKLKERRRLLSDASLKLWQTGLISLLASVLVWIYGNFFRLDNRDFLLALFFGLGFLGSIVKAMSNKIIPFLAWYHLTSRGIWDAPSVREMISDKAANFELYLHLASIVTFAFSLSYSPLFLAGSILASLSFATLTYNILKTVRIYNDYNQKSKVG